MDHYARQLESLPFGNCCPNLRLRIAPIMLIAVWISLTWTWNLSAQTGRDQDVASINSPQVIVMNNGEVLLGMVEGRPLDVTIRTRSGSRIVLKRDRIAFIANSFSEAYWEKLARIKASDVDGQVQLFYWCLKHRLKNEAGNQIDVLASTKMNATKLARLNELYHDLLTAKPGQEDRSRNQQTTQTGIKKSTPTKRLSAGKTPEPDIWDAPHVAKRIPAQQATRLPRDRKVGAASFIESIEPQPTGPKERPSDSLRPRGGNSPLKPIGKIPALNNKGRGTRGFVPVDRFDPEIFNRLQKEREKRSRNSK